MIGKLDKWLSWKFSSKKT